MTQPKTFRKWWVIAFIVVLVIAVAVVDLVYGWPIIRTAGYRALVEQYAHATPMAAIPKEGQPSEWSFEHSLSSGTRVRVQAQGFMDVVKIQYADEPGPHGLYRYVDYSSPVALRTDGNILYVYWSETLIHVDRWLLAYDLASRREIDRRRVDPSDIGGTKTASRE